MKTFESYVSKHETQQMQNNFFLTCIKRIRVLKFSDFKTKCKTCETKCLFHHSNSCPRQC